MARFNVSHFLPLTPAMFQVLVALADGEKHGYAILKEVTRRTGGKVTLRAGTLYTVIGRFVDDALIEEIDERPDPALDDERRRYYRLTERGRAVAVAETERLAETLDAGARQAGPAGEETPMTDRLFRLLLRLLPEEFRAAYARDMAATFGPRARRPGRRARNGARWPTSYAARPASSRDILRRDLRLAIRTLTARPLRPDRRTCHADDRHRRQRRDVRGRDGVLLAPLPYRDADAPGGRAGNRRAAAIRARWAI